MSTATVHPHHARASGSDLMAFARYWEWERTVAHELPGVIAGAGVRIRFQPIYQLMTGMPIARGFEALSRFPVAPRIPVGLWFRVAQDLGLTRDLELATIREAIESLQPVSAKAFLCVNASIETLPELAAIIPAELRDRLIVDVPCRAIHHPMINDNFLLLRDGGARIAIDDVPIDALKSLRPILLDLQPEFIKLDVLSGLAQSEASRLAVAEGAVWCRNAGIGLIAERVTSLDDLAALKGAGVEWAQGYCLSPAVQL